MGHGVACYGQVIQCDGFDQRVGRSDGVHDERITRQKIPEVDPQLENREGFGTCTIDDGPALGMPASICVQAALTG
jgi:hypothetical protein